MKRVGVYRIIQSSHFIHMNVCNNTELRVLHCHLNLSLELVNPSLKSMLECCGVVWGCFGCLFFKPSWHVTYLTEALENSAYLFINNMHAKNYLCNWPV